MPQTLDLLDRHVSGDHAAGFRIVIEAVEAAVQPIGDRGAAARRESQ